MTLESSDLGSLANCQSPYKTLQDTPLEKDIQHLPQAPSLSSWARAGVPRDWQPLLKEGSRSCLRIPGPLSLMIMAYGFIF